MSAGIHAPAALTPTTAPIVSVFSGNFQSLRLRLPRLKFSVLSFQSAVHPDE